MQATGLEPISLSYTTVFCQIKLDLHRTRNNRFAGSTYTKGAIMKESPNNYYNIILYKICQIPKNICSNLIEIIPIKLTIENIKYTILSLI